MTISVPELMRTIVLGLDGLAEAAPGGVIVGPATDTQQELGVVEIAERGVLKVDLYARTLRGRVLTRVIAPTVRQSEQIKNILMDGLHTSETDATKTRRVVHQNSSDEDYLVHLTYFASGPSFGPSELKNRWEQVMTVELMAGRDPING